MIQIKDLEPIFTACALRRNIVSPTVCFLCGKNILTCDLTAEHIVPRWVQELCNLSDKRITFRNGTNMLYKRATVPCCKKCNNECLSRLESYISERFRQGKEGIRLIPIAAWYLWIGKIRLALAYKDCLLAQDRRDSESGRLGTPAEVDEISVVRHLLQFIRFDHEAVDRMRLAPDSVFVFFCQDPDDVDYKWDFYNLLKPMVTALRIGKAGVVVAFRDERFIEAAYGKKLIPYRFLDLHPMQFIEVFARVGWAASHQHTYSIYFTSAGMGAFGVERVPAWNSSPRELFDELDHSRFPRILHEAQGIKSSTVPDGHHHSILHYDDPQVIYPIPWSCVKAPNLGYLFGGKGWIDIDNVADIPHFGPDHLTVTHSD